MVLGALLLQFLRLTLVASQAKPGCQDKCGDISILYPFGIGENCSREGFSIDCNRTEDRFVPYISTSNIDITHISLSTGELGITQYISRDCYNKSGFQVFNNLTSFRLSTRSPFTFSHTQNKFTALGCDTYAYIGDFSEFETGCRSICEKQSMVTNESCNGIGCCQTSIPKGVKQIKISVKSYNNHTNVSAFNPCSYAFLADLNWFKFHGLSDLSSEFYEKNNGGAPLVLDWVVGNWTCEEAKRGPNSYYACVSENSYCYDSTNGPGYRCNCSFGYEGNPYLYGGCQDIDECKDNKVAIQCRGICTNTQGSYSCECPKEKHSVDPRLYDCKSSFPIVPVALGIGIPLILIVIGSWIYLGFQTRKFINLKEKFFQQNGGFDLQRLLSSHPSTTFKIFSKEELERATNNFDEKNVLGRGGHGTVFKGVLADNCVLAIKKCLVTNDEVLNKQFANEMFILSQINHKNVVKLLGCCVEVEIPMLVYEFISNGTLFDFIHSRRQLCLNCLRIATEAASALAYLHWDASPPILHGDVKSSNILLDKNLMVKVSDFGASKLTPKGTYQFVTFIQGTWGYLDPEYLQTGQLTDKSDVYSFGVVLLELLTRKMAILRQGIEEERNLANFFLSSMKEERLIDVLDDEMVNEGRMDLILEVCNLAKRCLNIGGEERPTMREVAMELEGLIGFHSHPWVIDNSEDTERLIGGSSNIYIQDIADCYSSDKSAILSIEAGR